MIDTEDDLRELLRATVAGVQAPERVRHFAPTGRRRLHPRHSVVVLIPLVAVLAAGAAAAVTSLQSTSSRTSRIFLRETADGVYIRSYTFSGVSGFTGELSTDRAVGLVFADRAHLGPTKVRAEDVTVFGTNGHDATAVAVRAGSDVSTVTVRFSRRGERHNAPGRRLGRTRAPEFPSCWQPDGLRLERSSVSFPSPATTVEPGWSTRGLDVRLLSDHEPGSADRWSHRQRLPCS